MGKKNKNNGYGEGQVSAYEAVTIDGDKPQALEVIGNEERSDSQQTRTMETFIGLSNRRNHAITVALKKDSFLVSPGARTGKDYKQADIVAVQGMALQAAVAAGICSVVR